MGSRTLYTQVVTDQGYEAIWQAITAAFATVGGQQEFVGSGLRIKGGKQGVNFGFTLEPEAMVYVRDQGPNRHEIECQLKWKPSNTVWACLIIGFFVLGILWLVGLFYLLAKPEETYDQALHRVQGMLPQPQMQPVLTARAGGYLEAPAAMPLGWAAPAVVSATVPQDTAEGVNFCPECGAKQAKAGARFCMKCGEQLQPAS